MKSFHKLFLFILLLVFFYFITVLSNHWKFDSEFDLKIYTKFNQKNDIGSNASDFKRLFILNPNISPLAGVASAPPSLELDIRNFNYFWKLDFIAQRLKFYYLQLDKYLLDGSVDLSAGVDGSDLVGAIVPPFEFKLKETNFVQMRAILFPFRNFSAIDVEIAGTVEDSVVMMADDISMRQLLLSIVSLRPTYPPSQNVVQQIDQIKIVLYHIPNTLSKINKYSNQLT